MGKLSSWLPEQTTHKKLLCICQSPLIKQHQGPQKAMRCYCELESKKGKRTLRINEVWIA